MNVKITNTRRVTAQKGAVRIRFAAEARNHATNNLEQRGIP
jgi:hypothetical protein